MFIKFVDTLTSIITIFSWNLIFLGANVNIMQFLFHFLTLDPKMFAFVWSNRYKSGSSTIRQNVITKPNMFRVPHLTRFNPLKSWVSWGILLYRYRSKIRFSHPMQIFYTNSRLDQGWLMQTFIHSSQFSNLDQPINSRIA